MGLKMDFVSKPDFFVVNFLLSDREKVWIIIGFNPLYIVE